MDENLPELRDIHLLADVSAWPLAYGWWLLAAGIILGILLMQFFLYWRRYSKSRYAIKLLNNVSNRNIIAAAQQMSEILRRICVYKYKPAASLSGAEWIKFLNSHSKTSLSGKPAELLLNAPCLPDNDNSFSTDDIEHLRVFCQKWIGENL